MRIMKITTAEIKLLLKECIKTDKIYTISDFSSYISQNSDKTFTKSQISGAVNQLLDLEDIVRIERGLYKRNIKEKDISNIERHKKTQFMQESVDFLENIENNFNIFISSKISDELEDVDFEILSKMMKIKKEIRKLHNICNLK